MCANPFITLNFHNCSALCCCCRTQTWKLQAERKKYRQEWFEAWKEEKNNFDVVICPVATIPACPHETYKDLSFAAAYTLLFNLLDLPAGLSHSRCRCCVCNGVISLRCAAQVLCQSQRCRRATHGREIDSR